MLYGAPHGPWPLPAPVVLGAIGGPPAMPPMPPGGTRPLPAPPVG